MKYLICAMSAATLRGVASISMGLSMLLLVLTDTVDAKPVNPWEKYRAAQQAPRSAPDIAGLHLGMTQADALEVLGRYGKIYAFDSEGRGQSYATDQFSFSSCDGKVVGIARSIEGGLPAFGTTVGEAERQRGAKASLNLQSTKIADKWAARLDAYWSENNQEGFSIWIIDLGIGAPIVRSGFSARDDCRDGS